MVTFSHSQSSPMIWMAMVKPNSSVDWTSPPGSSYQALSPRVIIHALRSSSLSGACFSQLCIKLPLVRSGPGNNTFICPRRHHTMPFFGRMHLYSPGTPQQWISYRQQARCDDPVYRENPVPYYILNTPLSVVKNGWYRLGRFAPRSRKPRPRSCFAPMVSQTTPTRRG